MGIDKNISVNPAPSKKNWGPATWVPTLYLTEGLPYTIVMTLTVVFYKQMGFNNAEVAFYTSWLYLPWVIKPFWSPFVDMYKTKRWWILSMQLLMGAGFAAIGLLLSNRIGHTFAISLAIFWLIAFNSATHDIAADGFYIIALNDHQQSFYVGIRNTFYRISVILGQGALLLLVGYLEDGGQASAIVKSSAGVIHTSANLIADSNETTAAAWAITFYITAAFVIAMHLYHSFSLPKPNGDQTADRTKLVGTFLRTFYKFLKKKHFWMALSFILLFRLGEAQLGKVSQLFMLDSINNGGLGLNAQQIGIVYGTAGVIALTIGGLLGGFVVAKDGLKKWFVIMTLFMNVPNLVYVFMAYTQPENMVVITSLVCIEQFGYGFGFTAFMLYLIYYSRGQYKTTFYAICTGFMALGMMLPGLVAGKIQEVLGYPNFFIWVCVCTIPGFIFARLLPFDENFGKKES